MPTEPMSRIDVLREVCKLAQRLNSDVHQLTVYEITTDDDKALSPRTGLLHTIVRTGNVQHVAAGADVVVLHAQKADVLQAQIAHLLAIGAGFIVIPNTNPAEEAYQAPAPTSSVWTGDGWKAVARLWASQQRYLVTVKSDHGTTVICPDRGESMLLPKWDLPDPLDWAELSKGDRRYGMLNLRRDLPPLADWLLAPPVEPQPVAESSAAGTVPANALEAGTVLRGSAWGEHAATTGSETITLKLGSVVIATVEPTTTPAPPTPARPRRTRRSR